MQAAHALALFCLLALGGFSYAAEEPDWPVGRWELVHDPEGREQDWLEFMPNGDAYSIWPNGTKVPGIYVVTEDGIKAVFSLKDRDIIATFHVDAARQQLRIVTSETGRESVYRKLP